MELYFTNLCRPVTFTYRRPVNIHNTSALRFAPAATTFHSASSHAENSCYCTTPVCHPSGIFDMGDGCKARTTQLRHTKPSDTNISNQHAFPCC